MDISHTKMTMASSSSSSSNNAKNNSFNNAHNNNQFKNSYESEPLTSSGSCSSACREHRSFSVTDINKLSSPCLLKPQSSFYVDNTDILTTTINKEFLIDKSLNEFEGFNYSDCESELKQNRNREQFKVNGNKIKNSKLIYDNMIMEENSCNAVYIPFNADGDHFGITDCCNPVKINNSNSIMHLSFNGKITSRKSEDNHVIDKQNENSKKNRVSLSSSITLISGTETWQPQFLDTSEYCTFTKQSNKYRNSPDLFADEDDENCDDGNTNENCNGCESKNNYNSNDTSEKAANHSGLQTTTSWNDMKSIVLKDLCLEKKDASYREYNNIKKELQINTDIFKDHNKYYHISIRNVINNKDLFEKYQENCKSEKLMNERIRKSLSGILPPPSVTIPQLDMFTAVLSHKNAILNFLNNITSGNDAQSENKDSSGNENEPFVDGSLLKPTCTLDEARSTGWPSVLTLKHHGLCYNLCEDSENNDYLSLSVIERFIGAEMASSYINPNLISKRRKPSIRPKSVCQSPGNRLSHLARRRSIFSSANLANNSLRAHNLIGPQIILDKRKSKAQFYNGRNTPKRKTPSSKRKSRRKTPTSSARKRLFYNDVTTTLTGTTTTNTITMAGPTIETVKRAIFQSPTKDKAEKSSSVGAPATSTSTSVPFSKLLKSERLEKSKRALLFSLENGTDIEGESQEDIYSLNPSLSPKSHCPRFTHALRRKRREIGENDAETEDDEFSIIHNSKLFKSYNETGLTPRALNIKSQSFCIAKGSTSRTLAQTSQILQQQALQSSQQYQEQQQFILFNTKHSSVTSDNFLQSLQCNIIDNIGNKNNNTAVIATGNNTLQRALSDTIITKSSLTENQKKKLLWAVSQALQDKKITVKHEKFKHYAAILARLVKRIFQEYYQKNCTSHNETMLRLAKRYVYQVMQDFTLDDIYMQAKQQIEDMKRPHNKRLMGYISPEEFENLKQQELQNQQQVPQANKIMSLNKMQMFKQQHQQPQQHQQQKKESTVSNYDIFAQRQLKVNSTATSIISASTNTANSISKRSISTSICARDAKAECEGEMGAKLKTKTPNHLTNSSSKSNLNGSVLRENSVECCLTRSAQKLFTGKDQRNKSPYATIIVNGAGVGSGVSGGQTYSAKKVQNQLINNSNSNSRVSEKARRQIIFDC